MTEFPANISIVPGFGNVIAPSAASNVSVCDRPSNTSTTESAIAFLGLGDRPCRFSDLILRSLDGNSSII
ncbi:MAG: hypothetical protein WCD18_26850 [Thermosynechococcaceae cyanobacterium]